MSIFNLSGLMDRRTVLALGGTAAAAALVGPAAASDLYGPNAAGAKSGGTLNMGLLVEPPGLDPFHQAADARIRLTVLIYQGLFYESPDGKATPLLAEGFDLSADRLVYTIRLRKDVKFHTGQA
ncbi:MAG: transporter substrate-binding protein, partial [Tardiphaga sp.]|nr:transporter substrate-binding protein [Tardiphaga sp.]